MDIVLALSGGMDSAVLLWLFRSQGHLVRCLGVDYGQRHRRELTAAKDICLDADVEHRIVDLRGIRDILSGSSQTSDNMAVPLGHYTDESMKQTVVPNRNMVLLALAGAWAVATRSEAIAYAAHAGDHAIYPDCRPEFAAAMHHAFSLCDWHPVRLLQPFLFPIPMDKTAIARLGYELGVPFHKTWSCYQGGEVHCGQCGTCVERKEAFALAGIVDPTTYAEIR